MFRKGLIVLVILAGVIGMGTYLLVQRLAGSDSVRATLEERLSDGLRQPVHIGSASASIIPRVAIDLHDVTIGEPVAVRLGRVRVVTGLRPLLSRRIQDAEIIVGESRLDLSRVASLVPAAASARPGQASAPSPVAVASIRRIALQDVSLVAGDRTAHVDVESSIDGDTLRIARLTARADRTRLRGSGTVNLARLDGTLDLAAEPLDLDELIAIGSALTMPSSSGSPGAAARSPGAGTPPHLKVTVTSPAGQFGAYAFRNLSTTIDLVPERFLLSPLDATIFGGRFTGTLEADMRRPVPRMTLVGRTEGVNVAELMKTSGAPTGITGTLGGTVTIAAEGLESNALMHSARGTIAAAITNGTMPGLDMVRTIVLAFGKPSGAPPQGSGSAFSRLEGTFALAGEALASENLALASRDFDMHGRGTLRMTTGAVNAAADVALSQELTAQAGTDLRRYAQQDGRVIVPVAISGTLDRPSVSADIAAATRRALLNELERRATSFLDGVFKKKKGG